MVSGAFLCINGGYFDSGFGEFGEADFDAVFPFGLEAGVAAHGVHGDEHVAQAQFGDDPGADGAGFQRNIKTCAFETYAAPLGFGDGHLFGAVDPERFRAFGVAFRTTAIHAGGETVGGGGQFMAMAIHQNGPDLDGGVWAAATADGLSGNGGGAGQPGAVKSQHIALARGGGACFVGWRRGFRHIG